MTLLRTILFLPAAIVLGLTTSVSANWLLTVPPTDGPAITFFDGTGQPQATGLLTNFTLNWQSDFMAGISRTFSVFCISPDMGTVDVGQPYPGTNRICITAQYSDGATVNYTNVLVGSGFEFWTTDGSSNLAYQVKAHMADLSWTPETAASPFLGYYSAPEQYFELASNVTNCWFQNSLQAEQPIDTNVNETASVPPTP